MIHEEFIRVAARVRKHPSAPREKVVSVNEIGGISFRVNENNERFFRFDNVFGESSSQANIFVEVGKRVIDGCLAGYNGTIFAYGQTGSGKTYTMFGPQDENGAFKKNAEGLVPRGMDYLLEQLNMQKEESHGRFSFSVNCSFVQLYNEGIYDLLDRDKASVRLKLQTDVKTKAVHVVDASVEQIETTNEVHELLRIGFRNRCVAETNMNRESSRSHAIFIVNIATRLVEEGVIHNRAARLNLVDLAGSERQADSKATGTLLKEANCINKSLSILTRVIRSLIHNPGQYPGYRDSPLTRLLQDSLGGNTRSTVIVTLHPDVQYADTTLSTLNFSETVKCVKNNAVINENIAGENMNALREEVRRMRDELAANKCALEKTSSLEEEVKKLNESLATKVDQIAQLELEIQRLKDQVEKHKAAGGDRKASNASTESVASSATAEKIAEMTAKLAASEKRALVAEKRSADSEKTIADFKAALQQRESDIAEYEKTLNYKANRLNQVRTALDKLHETVCERDEEIASLKEKLTMAQVNTSASSSQISQPPLKKKKSCK